MGTNGFDLLSIFQALFFKLLREKKTTEKKRLKVIKFMKNAGRGSLTQLLSEKLWNIAKRNFNDATILL